jgi:hypothetical protein
MIPRGCECFRPKPPYPQVGHAQAGWRPAVVLAPSAYNGRVGLSLLCPITHQRKAYPFIDEASKFALYYLLSCALSDLIADSVGGCVT